ncbi:PilT/PilU family type 4a pilus ATPase [Candidatus Thiothrix sp. Deng01]|uniref:PilT/PilU family type 4a pilus ATPase n=1 Tax=Candidatus Thiothrix phosphatis TaxID=3112415 RepID=A0ABU6CWX8_9GAMM|nr:PilT/PilU family type 4a pilus ATPase [Candidatus Thiothrix sp. Deng01]MEB4591313.1 PilT/PilU family type 4a pilus ATPase [Candidatus Thiothrix sp. Deng01]
MDRDSAVSYVHKLLAAMLEKNASDLYITADAAPSAKINSELTPLAGQPLNEQSARMLVRAIMNDRQLKQFEEEMECNFSISLPGKARFRVNAFTQRGCSGMVLRHIPSHIPGLKDLGLPPVLRDIVMTKRGLVIMVGATGSGKSTTLASMLDYRNDNSKGHIVTIEDPIEFVHQHKGCLITQREIGVDTSSYDVAMKNTLRQAPDVILLGEIRDRETMDYAVAYAETGHLCLSTLHANSSNQALDRIINFFPEERRPQLLMDLSLNLKAVVSQRLVRKAKGDGRLPAVEVMINTPLMADLILKGDVPGMKVLTSKSREQGMRTFDQALFDLIETRQITVQEGLRHADSQNDLRLRLKLESRFAKENDFFKGLDNMAIEPMETGR